MHVPQSQSPVGSQVSGKLSRRSQPPFEWTHQRPSPLTCTATPWIQCVPLPHLSAPIFADEQALETSRRGDKSVNQPAPPLGYYYPAPGQFAPYISPIPLPPSPAPSSSRHSSHSTSRSSPTLPYSRTPSITPHPLLTSTKIQFLDIIRVHQPFDRTHLNDTAFKPAHDCVQIQIHPDKAVGPLIVQNLGSLTVQSFLRALHDHLHADIMRPQFACLAPETQANARASFDARRAKRPEAYMGGMKLLDVLGFGAKDFMFVGLNKCDGPVNALFPVFIGRPSQG
ncbi:hypothetical protein B0H11DRAFT_1967619 [Mycena galericulata]|nr:hypothetical protein B0H11DRAFT_2131431 [Mycena galericulata]KAJ7507547.1 hypothetical protein B0H11DRAFT_1967619 [Mycena galericulata]